MQIWGRANSVNVQKVLWTAAELGLDFERIDCGGPFGGLDTPEYRALNPNGVIPTLTDGSVVLWESNTVCRYLARRYGRHSGLYGDEPERACLVDRWLDWALSTLQPTERHLFWQMIRTPQADRDQQVIETSHVATGKLWQLLDRHLEGRTYVEAESLTLADIVLGSLVHRWFGIPGLERESLPNLEGWYGRLQERPGYRAQIFKTLT